MWGERGEKKRKDKIEFLCTFAYRRGTTVLPTGVQYNSAARVELDILDMLESLFPTETQTLHLWIRGKTSPQLLSDMVLKRRQSLKDDDALSSPSSRPESDTRTQQ